MAFKYQVTNQQGLYFITTTVVGWIDVFTRRELAEVVVDSLNYCVESKGLLVHAWCLMPNHLHMIISGEENNSVSEIMRDFKKFTSKRIISTIKEIQESRTWMIAKFQFAAKTNFKSDQYKFWQTGFHPIQLESEKFVNQKLTYIHQNPVKAGLVFEEQHYRYSSAIDYHGGIGLVPVVLL